MRNYLSFVKQDFDIWDGTDPMNPVQIGILSRVEDDEEDMAAFAASLPSAGAVFYTPQAAGYPYWPLLDKAIIKNVLNNTSSLAFNQWLVQQGDEGTPERNPKWPTSDGDLGRERQKLPKGGKTTGGGSGTFQISLLSYLLLLLNTWQTQKPTAPKRWIDWLTLLISHYGRYTPTQIYGFLARVNFADATFRV